MLRIVTSDSVTCAAFPIPVPSRHISNISLRLDPETRSLVCVFQDQVVWRAASDKAFDFSCRPRSILPHVLVLTDNGELQVQQQHSDGSSVVEWSSKNRLVKLR